MKLNIKETGYFPLSEEIQIKENKLLANARGGTELMYDALMSRMSVEHKNRFQIIKSRVRELDPTKRHILWLHDTYDDPESKHLSDKASLKRFDKLVFVSNYQFTTYNVGLGVPYDNSIVIRNAIEPIPSIEKPMEVCRIIYHTTPHRGLELLVPVFEKLYEVYENKIHLDVYSSFSIYGWKERDKEYKDLIERCIEHKGITYHGAVPNAEVRKALQKAHIFAYPSIWPETSCIAAIEAMSAGCLVVCPNFGALPETTSNFSIMYPWSSDIREHANRFGGALYNAIESFPSSSVQNMLKYQKNYIDTFYNWDLRMQQWNGLFNEMLKRK